MNHSIEPRTTILIIRQHDRNNPTQVSLTVDTTSTVLAFSSEVSDRPISVHDGIQWQCAPLALSPHCRQIAGILGDSHEEVWLSETRRILSSHINEGVRPFLSAMRQAVPEFDPSMFRDATRTQRTIADLVSSNDSLSAQVAALKKTLDEVKTGVEGLVTSNGPAERTAFATEIADLVAVKTDSARLAALFHGLVLTESGARLPGSNPLVRHDNSPSFEREVRTHVTSGSVTPGYFYTRNTRLNGDSFTFTLPEAHSSPIRTEVVFSATGPVEVTDSCSAVLLEFTDAKLFNEVRHLDVSLAPIGIVVCQILVSLGDDVVGANEGLVEVSIMSDYFGDERPPDGIVFFRGHYRIIAALLGWSTEGRDGIVSVAVWRCGGADVAARASAIVLMPDDLTTLPEGPVDSNADMFAFLFHTLRLRGPDGWFGVPGIPSYDCTVMDDVIEAFPDDSESFSKIEHIDSGCEFPSIYPIETFVTGAYGTLFSRAFSVIGSFAADHNLRENYILSRNALWNSLSPTLVGDALHDVVWDLLFWNRRATSGLSKAMWLLTSELQHFASGRRGNVLICMVEVNDDSVRYICPSCGCAYATVAERRICGALDVTISCAIRVGPRFHFTYLVRTFLGARRVSREWLTPDRAISSSSKWCPSIALGGAYGRIPFRLERKLKGQVHFENAGLRV